MSIFENCNRNCFEINGRPYHNKTCVNERRRKSYLKNIEKRHKYNKTIKARYAQGRSAASKRGYAWELTLDEYSALILNSNCHYCYHVLSDTGSGLDRKDNNIGYMLDNCVPCCAHCNGFKGHYLTYAEMVAVMAFLKTIR